MADASAAIRITIDSTGAESGARRVNSSIDSITGKGRSLTASNDNLSSSFDKIGRSMAGSAGGGGKLAGIFDTIRGKAASASPAVGELAGSLGQVGLMGGAIAAVAVAIGAIAAKSIEAAAQVEIWKANLLTVTGDAKKAQDSYGALVAFAAKTPFDLSQSVEGFIKLRTLGLQATEGAMVSFGNTAAAMGKPLSQMIEAVADAATGEFERLKEFGIKSKVQGDMVAFTFGGVTEKVKNNASEIQKYLEKLGNTKFAGAMARQMDTIKGAASNVEDSIFQMFAAIGGGQLGAGFKEILKTIAATIGVLTPLMGSLGNAIGAIVKAVGSIINGLVSMFAAFHGGAGNMQKGLDALVWTINIIAESVDFAGKAIGGVFDAIAKVINNATGASGKNEEAMDKAGKSTANWTQILHQYWDDLALMGKNAQNAVIGYFIDLGDTIKSVFTDAGDWLGGIFKGPIDGIKGMFSGLGDSINKTYGDLEFSPEGFVVGAARTVDLVVGHFRGGVAAIKYFFANLPSALYQSLSPFFKWVVDTWLWVAGGVAKAASFIFNAIVSFNSAVVSTIMGVYNFVAGYIEKFVNSSIKGINQVIKAANGLGAGMSTVAEIKLKVTAPPPPKATPLGNLWTGTKSAYTGGYGHEVEDSAKGFLKRARNQKTDTGGAGGLDSGNGGPKPKPDPTKDGDGGRKAAEEAAKRAQAEKDFYETLKQEIATSAMLPLRAEEYKKQLELQKILKRDLNALEIIAINSTLEKIRTNKFLVDAQEAHAKAARTIGDEEAVYAMRAKGMTDDQIDVERKMFDFRNSAIEKGVNLQDAGYKVAEAQARKDAERLGILKKQNSELANAVSFAKSAYGETPDGKKANAQTTYDSLLKNLTAARDGGAISPAEFQAGVKKAGDDFREAVGQGADAFADRMNKLADVFGKLGTLIGGKLGAVIGKVGDVSKSVGDFKTNSKGVEDSITAVFKGSEFGKTLGKAFGGAMAGLQIGESIAGLGKALGLKGGETGAKIGGALGGLTGNPLIAAAASVVGSIIGSLFYKAPKGQATITGVNNVALSGNSAQLQQAASGMAGGVTSGLSSIAAELGATIGAFNVSIGMYNDKIRVNPTGGAVGGVKGSGAISYASEDEAVKAAIQFAIKQGALTGLSDIAQKAVKTLDIDSAVTFVKDFNAAMADFASMTDPVTAAVQAVTKGLDALHDNMVKVGASTSDLTKLDEYRALKLQQVLKDQSKGFQDILDQLNGDAGGFTALTQLRSELTDFEKFKSDIAAGKTVDQDAYSALANKIIGNAGSVYGTNTTDYQSIIGSLRDATTDGLANVATAFNTSASPASSTTTTDTSTAAINAQTDAITAGQGITNDLLRQILENQTFSNDNYDYVSPGNYNGKLAGAY